MGLMYLYVDYLAFWNVADEVLPIAPNPTPTAKPSEIKKLNMMLTHHT